MLNSCTIKSNEGLFYFIDDKDLVIPLKAGTNLITDIAINEIKGNISCASLSKRKKSSSELKMYFLFRWTIYITTQFH